jgi:aminopeptidase-like protein
MEVEEEAKRIEKYFDRLFPITRSLTGNGNRRTLEILGEIVEFKINEVPSGTKCFDWVVPPEWNVVDAWVKNISGKKIIDYKTNNLHLMGYSVPVHKKMDLGELKQHLYSDTTMPNAIPYVTSYYKKNWGFALADKHLKLLTEDEYEVFIDSSFKQDGSMTYGEAYIRGDSDKEILFSTYICHPSLASDNLSGPLVVAFIYEKLKKMKLKFSYRFLYMPETIGSIYYLSKYGEQLKKNLLSGFVVTTIGDNGKFSYKKSRQGNALCDRAAELVLTQTEKDFNIIDFFPRGSDERQYCSPGFDMPIGSLMRTPYGMYSHYHTSKDNKDYIDFNSMVDSIDKYLKIVEVMETNAWYVNQNPYCEPHLEKYKLYSSVGAKKKAASFDCAISWVLNYSDGNFDLIDIALKSKLNYDIIVKSAKELVQAGLLKNKT